MNYALDVLKAARIQKERHIKQATLLGSEEDLIYEKDRQTMQSEIEELDQAIDILAKEVMKEYGL